MVNGHLTLECIQFTNKDWSHTKRQCFRGVSTNFWIRPVTWLHSVHDIAVPIPRSPQCSWQGLVLAEMRPAQWVTLQHLGLFYKGDVVLWLFINPRPSMLYHSNLTILYMYSTGGTECLSCTPSSHSACAMRKTTQNGFFPDAENFPVDP